MVLTSSDAMHAPAFGYVSTEKSLHEAREALREHLVCHLSLPTLMALSKASTEWRQLILTTPFFQLPSHARKLLLPKDMSSQRSLWETLQERAALMAELRRHYSPNHKIGNHQICNKIMNPDVVQGLGKDVLWSPQPDISKPSQYLLLFREQIWLPGSCSYESIATVLDLPVGKPLEFISAVCSLPIEGAAAEAASGSSKEIPEQAQHVNMRKAVARWTADGQRLVIKHHTSPSKFGRLMLADLAQQTVDIICQANGLEYFDPGHISPTGKMWIPSEDGRCSPRHLKIYHIPNLELHFSKETPDAVTTLPPAQWRIGHISWSPDGSMLGITWRRDARPGRQHIRPCVAIYRARDGACLTSIILPAYRWRIYRAGALFDADDHDDPGDDNDDKYIEPGLFLHWGRCSALLLCQQADRIACITPLRGYAWCSSNKQRNPQSSHRLETKVTMAPSGCYLCVDDKFGHRERVLSMLNANDGKIMAAWSLGFNHMLGTLVWAADSDVCQFSSACCGDSFVLIPAAAAAAAAAAAHSTGTWPANANLQTVSWGPSTADHLQPITSHDSASSNPDDLFWHMFVLVVPGPSRKTLDSYFKCLEISPCGTIMTGAWQQHGVKFPDENSRSRAELCHWHLPRATSNLRIPISADNLALHVQPQKCTGVLLPPLLIGHAARLAWHPQPNACLYAWYNWQKGVCLVNAKSNAIVRSWTLAELAGHILEHSSTTDSMDGIDGRWPWPELRPMSALEWSHDRRRLAVLMGNHGCTVHCAVLEF